MPFNRLRHRIWILAGLATMMAAALAQTTQPQTRPQAPAATNPAQSKPEDAAPIVYVLMTTSKGDIVLELSREKAPISVANFLSYVDKGFYDGTTFHRVMVNFMIQGGGFTPDMKLKTPDAPIQNEWQNGLQNARGTVAMARIGGQPDSATSQFFINVKDNPMLDRPQRDGVAYAVFGKVVAGMNGAVEAIRTVAVVFNPVMREVSKPSETIMIEKVTRLTPDEAKKRMDAERQLTNPAASQPASIRSGH